MLRSIHRWFAVLAGATLKHRSVGAFALAGLVLATPGERAGAQSITYHFSGTADVPALGGPHLFDFRFTGFTTTVQDLSALLGLPAGQSVLINQATTALVGADGGPLVSLDSVLGGGSTFVVGAVRGVTAVPSPFGTGIGFAGLSGGGIALAFYLPTTAVATYDLTSAFGPITGTAYGFAGPIPDPSALDPADAIIISDASFSAVLSTPEPGSITLTATGLIAVAGVVRRRRTVTR